MPTTESFTVAQAAEGLGVSEKTIRRLIKDGKLLADAVRFRGGKKYLVKQWALDHYRLREWTDQQFCEFRLPESSGSSEFSIGTFGSHFVFGPWKEGKRLPQANLTVSLEDLWRFAYQPVGSKEAYDTLVDELRQRIPGRPLAFEVQFSLNHEEVLRAMKAIVNRVTPPEIPGHTKKDLKTEALSHLLQHLPYIANVKENLRGYLGLSVKNFYRDKTRKSRCDIPTDDVDLDTFLEKPPKHLEGLLYNPEEDLIDFLDHRSK